MPCLACAQEKKYNSVLVDKAGKFEIKREDEIIKMFFREDVPEIDTVRANLMANNDSLRQILFTRGRLRKDTLDVLIHFTSSAYHLIYKIKIAKGKFRVGFSYLTSGADLERKIIPIDYTLKLNSLDFKRGKEIRGYTEFKGKCKGEGCYGEENIEVKGNFKVLIK